MSIEIPASHADTLRIIAESPADLARLESVYRLGYLRCEIDMLAKRHAEVDRETGTSVPMFLRKQVA